jgi:hypothetical protein
MSYRFVDSLRTGPGGNCRSILVLLESLSTNMYDLYSELTPDDGETNCPKHVEFHDKINL